MIDLYNKLDCLHLLCVHIISPSNSTGYGLRSPSTTAPRSFLFSSSTFTERKSLVSTLEDCLHSQLEGSGMGRPTKAQQLAKKRLDEQIARENQETDRQNQGAAHQNQAQLNQPIQPPLENRLPPDQQQNMQAQPLRERPRRKLFDGTDWSNFKFSVTVQFHHEKLYDVVSGATPRPAAADAVAADAWDTKNYCALTIIDQSVTDSVRAMFSSS